MRRSIWQAKIPTILGLIIIGIGLYFSQQLVQTTSIFTSRASQDQNPKEIRISNTTDTSFVLSYKTDLSVIGSINIGKDKNFGQIVPDDRDQVGNTTSHFLHYFTVKSLEPNTTYYFSIISGSETFQSANQPFSVTTKKQKDTFSNTPVSGKVINQEGGAPQEFIVYAIRESQIISTLGKDGVYTIDLGAFKNSASQEASQILVLSESLLSSATILLPVQDTIPTITMGKSYNFVSSTISPTDIIASDSAALGFASLQSQSSSKNLQLLTPKKDEGFSDQKPLFKGTAPPGTTISVTIHSDDAVTGDVITDKNGNWSFRPSTKLSPGTHTISIVMQDASGIVRTITQSFVVYAEGSSFTEPSVSPTQNPKVTPTVVVSPNPTSIPTPTPKSATPTVLPTTFPTPTSIPTLVPTVFPTSFPTATPVPITNTIANPGSSSFITIAISSLFVLVSGIGLFFLTLGGKRS